MGIQEIVDLLKEKQPSSHIILISVLPRGGVREDTSVQEVNKVLYNVYGNQTDSQVHYLDVTSHFEAGLDNVYRDLYNGDRLHLSPKGYAAWHLAMDPLLKRLLRDQLCPNKNATLWL